jgi:type I restriction enzyme R subunit
VGHDWETYIEEEKRKQLSNIIEEEHLKAAETEDFMERAFADGYVTETGTGIAHILPPSNPFLPESGEKKQTVIEKLKAYLNKFSNMLSDDSAGLDVFRKRKLKDVEDDREVRNLIFNMLQMDNDISDMEIQKEVIDHFGDEYPGMSLNDWRHIIEDYTSIVRIANQRKAKEIYLDLKMAASPENEEE